MKIQLATGVLCLLILTSVCLAWAHSEQSQVGPWQISTDGRRSWLRSPSNSSVARLNATPGGCQVQLQSLVLAGQVTWSSPCKLTPDPKNLASCSLRLTEDGDFQLLVLDKLAWNTNTSGRGVAAMRLLDSTGELVLLDAGNVTLWRSSDVPSSPACQAWALKPAMEQVVRLRSRRPRPYAGSGTHGSAACGRAPSKAALGFGLLVLAFSALAF